MSFKRPKVKCMLKFYFIYSLQFLIREVRFKPVFTKVFVHVFNFTTEISLLDDLPVGYFWDLGTEAKLLNWFTGIPESRMCSRWICWPCVPPALPRTFKLCFSKHAGERSVSQAVCSSHRRWWAAILFPTPTPYTVHVHTLTSRTTASHIPARSPELHLLLMVCHL